MLLSTTEKLSEGEALDALPPHSAVSALLAGQSAALEVVSHVAEEIDHAAELMAASIRSGRSLVYAAAGSSGLMALADACELPGTFGISPDAVRIFMAGGVPVDGHMPGDVEDDEDAAQSVAREIAAGDTVVVLSASGGTPYALAIARQAKAKGAKVIGIANNPDTALLDVADVPICLETPPEVIAGSTRLGAGTAQKAVLNIMSSLMGVKLGHVYQGMMVNVVADNAKLAKRATGIVSQIADVSDRDAQAALHSASGNLKAAILIAKGCSHTAAMDLLATYEGHLGPCLETLQ